MGMKRSAKAGDFKQAMDMLKEIDFVEGSPKSLMTKLNFDGSWREFEGYFKDFVIKTEIGRYAIFSPYHNNNGQKSSTESNGVDPEIFALCASSYILGVGKSEDFVDYNGMYPEIDVVTAALAEKIDETIGTLYLPYDTQSPIEIYSVERSLLYTSSEGKFQIYGSTLLSHV